MRVERKTDLAWKRGKRTLLEPQEVFHEKSVDLVSLCSWWNLQVLSLYIAIDTMPDIFFPTTYVLISLRLMCWTGESYGGIQRPNSPNKSSRLLETSLKFIQLYRA